MGYAEGTSVPVSKSQAEIRGVLEKYKATGFAFGEQVGFHMVMFEMSARRIKIAIPMPIAGALKPNEKYARYNQTEVEKETRRRWRCLLITIKAKLECVASGITTLEEEFLAHIVLPNGRTVGQEVSPRIEQSYKDGKMPPLLGYSA